MPVAISIGCVWCWGLGSCRPSGGPGWPARHLLLAMAGRAGLLPQLQPLVQPGCRRLCPLALCLKLQALLGLRVASLAPGTVKHPGLGGRPLLGKWPRGEPGGGGEPCLPPSLVPPQKSRASAFAPRQSLHPPVPPALPCNLPWGLLFQQPACLMFAISSCKQK